MTKSVTFIVPAATPSQGSMNAFPFKRKSGKWGVNQIDRNYKKIKEFRKMVSEIIEQYHGDFFVDDISVGYEVWLIVYIERPKKMIRLLPTVRGTGDIDKLLRAVLDALTYNADKNPSGLFKDDSQVVDAHVRKRYVKEEDNLPKAKITVKKVLKEKEHSKKEDFEEDELNFGEGKI